MLIRDLVTLNEDAELVNDVQLGWYPSDARNGLLAKGYIFTDKAPEGKKSSIAILEQVRDAFIYSRENRLVVIATYGHGKTHFALALANFFGMQANSDEVRQMLTNIAHASSEAKAQTLRDFKNGRSPYLVVRLRGDKPGTLPQQFLNGLETALGEQEATRDVLLPLWFDAADQFLGRLTATQRDTADAYLKKYELDCELLQRQVRSRASNLYEVCRLLSRELYGTALDFSSEVSLEQVVKLVVDNYCGENKPFAGLLILFDEFSEFIRRYAERRGMGGSSLQDLLDGVHSRQEYSAFVAFSQHDPDTVAQNIFRVTMDNQGQDTLSKELTRLPTPQRQTLFSSLETVLSAYLKQNEEGWNTVYDQAVAALDDATDTTMDLCTSRYADSGWDTERVAEVLTQGCFPMHPLTTALLCSVSLREVTNPRAVLGFVQEALGKRLDQSAITGRTPNWVYAIDLVDYFREMLADREWEQYQGAISMLGGDITDPQARVLKAMFLVAVATLKTRAIGYAKVISALSGMSRDECHLMLTELSENGHIHFDAATRAYSFWTAGAGGNRLDKEVKKYVETTLNIEALNQDWSGNGINRLMPIEISGIGWGSSKDYEANEYLLTRDTFTADRLRRMAPNFQPDAVAGMKEGVRGGLFWLVAESETDLTWFQDNAKQILDEAFPGEHPQPIVIALPSMARPQFISRVLRSQALLRVPPDVRREYGEEVLRTTADRYRQAIDEEVKQLKGATQFEVPAPYRVTLAQQGPVRTATRALEICYQAAYHDAPAAFFTQYSLSSQNLRKAVCRLSTYLCDNRMGASEEAQAVNTVARELVAKYLRVGPASSWGLVTTTDDLKPPSERHIQKAWEWLDASFKPGQPRKPVRDVLVPLFNAPFGYDYHHVLLLFSAWYGYYQQYLTMHNGVQRTSLSGILRNQEKPKDIVLALCSSSVVLSRKDKDEAEQELMALIQRMSQEVYTKSEAQNVLANLKALVNEEKLAESQRVSVQSARERVERGVERANDFTKAAEALQQRVERENAVTALVQQYDKVGSLPKLGCVTVPESLSVASLRSFILSRLNEVLETQCQKYKQLNALENYGLHKTALDSIARDLISLGQPPLLERVKAAQEVLNTKRDVLRLGSEEKQQDTAIVAELRATQAQGPLIQLRQSKNRLEEFEPRSLETRTLIDQKRDALERQISAMEQFATNLSDRLDKVTEGTQAGKLRDEAQRRIDSFIGTTEIEEVQRVCDRCERVEIALNRVSAYHKAIISSRTPGDLEELRLKTSRAREKAVAVLSEAQDAQFIALEADLDRQMANGRRAAQEWLEECRQESQQTSAMALNILMNKLDRAHPFLEESDASLVEGLRESVQRIMDENEVSAITIRFQRISDPNKRRECLDVLKAIDCGEESA